MRLGLRAHDVLLAERRRPAVESTALVLLGMLERMCRKKERASNKVGRLLMYEAAQHNARGPEQGRTRLARLPTARQPCILPVFCKRKRITERL